MADNNNTTKSKLLFMLSPVVLDYFHERIVACDKHRGFYNPQSLRMGYINVQFIFKECLKFRTERR